MSSSTKVLDLPSEVVKGDQRIVHCTGGAEDSEDSCDFNEIDNEIHDTLLNRQVSLESDTVLLASQKSFKLEAKELE